MSIPLSDGGSFESFFEDDEDLVVCIGCGCDDLHGCIGDDGEACHWLRVDDEEQLGVCSECPEHVARFNAGDRSLGPDASPAPKHARLTSVALIRGAKGRRRAAKSRRSRR